MRRRVIFLRGLSTWRCPRLRTSCWVLTRRGERLSGRLELVMDDGWTSQGKTGRCRNSFITGNTMYSKIAGMREVRDTACRKCILVDDTSAHGLETTLLKFMNM
jgi:hypothetical protein